MSENKKPTAVVVGATGIIGSAIVAKLSEVGGWRTIAVAQSGRTVPGADEAIGVDLMDSADAHRKLAAASEASHLFFAAYCPRGWGRGTSRGCWRRCRGIGCLRWGGLWGRM
jgi:nucleoside-diphosphate-sugar epimerase